MSDSPIAQAEKLTEAIKALLPEDVELPDGDESLLKEISQLPAQMHQPIEKFCEAKKALEAPPTAPDANADDEAPTPEVAYYTAVRAAWREFWVELARLDWPETSNQALIEHSTSIDQFNDALIRYGFPLELSPSEPWPKAAQDFVPGLDPLIHFTRTKRRRVGLRILKRAIRSTRVGYYDLEIGINDLGHSRRVATRRALLWLLNQPSEPLRPSGGLRDDVQEVINEIDGNSTRLIYEIDIMLPDDYQPPGGDTFVPLPGEFGTPLPTGPVDPREWNFDPSKPGGGWPDPFRHGPNV